MPELPEVEILVRRLAPLIKNRKIHGVQVWRARVLGSTSERALDRALRGATFTGLTRRGKYLLFALRQPVTRKTILLVGHLGMTGRIYLMPKDAALPRHAAVVLDLSRHNFIYEDTRYFGRFTLDARGLAALGPEPLEPEFTANYFSQALQRSAQCIKTKLLDQTLVAGVGNIYASEALFRAGISPRTAAANLTLAQVKKLRKSIREVLAAAIRFGSTLPLDFRGSTGRDRLFYYGTTEGEAAFHQERLLVYDRAGQPCLRCGGSVKRLVQNARSTFYCPVCQR
jgi:formamidopyrimidine-DNA glycosylase